MSWRVTAAISRRPEMIKMQFRGEAYHVSNHALFGATSDVPWQRKTAVSAN
jgi:hypothetical protein